jgi:TldD protein
VLFASGTAGAVLHEAVGHMAESDLVAAGTSPLAELEGATVSTPGLNLVDDPTRFDLPGGFDFDDEGEKAEPVTLIGDGRFEAFLCDREGGRRLGRPAGRGRRATWSRAPLARLSNLVVAPGSTDPEELEASVDHGLAVTRIGSATVDPVSFRMVLRVERGWEIRRGRRRRALAPCELTGNVLEALANLDPRIGSDPVADWRLGWCVKDGVPLPTGSECPSLLVEQMEVL